MSESDTNTFFELLVTLESLLVVQSEEGCDAYNDNYLRRHKGHIRLINDESEQTVEIGEIEVWYIDGSRASDNRLDIVDVCDSLGQEEYEYAAAIFTDGALDTSIVEYPTSNDVLVLHSIAILPRYRGRKYGLRVTQKMVATIGYHCGAILLRPAPLQFSAKAENTEWMDRMGMSAFSTDRHTATKKLVNYWKVLDLISTNDSSIYCVRSF